MSIDNLIIEGLRIEYEDQTAILFRRGFPELNGTQWDYAQTLDWYRRPYKELVYIARIGNEVVAACILTPNYENKSVEFTLTVTKPTHRKKGISKTLLTELDKLLQDDRCEYADAYCVNNHKYTQKIFKELGFKRKCKLEGYLRMNHNGKFEREDVVLYSKLYTREK